MSELKLSLLEHCLARPSGSIDASIAQLKPTLYLNPQAMARWANASGGGLRPQIGPDATCARASAVSAEFGADGRIRSRPANLAVVDWDGLRCTGDVAPQIAQSYITDTAQLGAFTNVTIGAWDTGNEYTQGIVFPDSATTAFASVTYADLSLVNNVVMAVLEMDDGSEPVPAASAVDAAGDFYLFLDGDGVFGGNINVEPTAHPNRYIVWATHLHDGAGVGYGVIRDAANSGKGFRCNFLQVYANTSLRRPIVITTGTADVELATDISIPISTTQTVAQGNWFKNNIAGVQSGAGTVIWRADIWNTEDADTMAWAITDGIGSHISLSRGRIGLSVVMLAQIVNGVTPAASRSLGPFVPGETCIVIAWDETEMITSRDGSAPVVDPLTAGLPLLDTAALGGGPVFGAALNMNANVGHFDYIPYKLSVAEIQRLSAL